MIKILIFVGWIFHKYKLFCWFIYKFIFKFLKFTILFINGKNIEEILKLDAWQTTRSVLFFFTNINIEEKPEKDFPVKRFKIKWYLWLIHYVWAFWVIIKLSMYLFIFHFYRYLKIGIWRDLWLMLLEYWRWRLNIFNWALHIIWHLLWLWYLIIGFILDWNNNTFLLWVKIRKIIKLVKPIIKVCGVIYKFKLVEKGWWLWLN